MSVVFDSQILEFQLDRSILYETWLHQVAKFENKTIISLEYCFVDEIKILEINRKFLDHHYLTDIITFDESFLDRIKGDIFICIPVVIENAKEQGQDDWSSELRRVIVHGLLHLLGYKDQTPDEKSLMRSMEDFYLEKFPDN